MIIFKVQKTNNPPPPKRGTSNVGGMGWMGWEDEMERVYELGLALIVAIFIPKLLYSHDA